MTVHPLITRMEDLEGIGAQLTVLAWLTPSLLTTLVELPLPSHMRSHLQRERLRLCTMAGNQMSVVTFLLTLHCCPVTHMGTSRQHLGSLEGLLPREAWALHHFSTTLRLVLAGFKALPLPS
jgi:hypothetical protein